ncbi:MAG: peptidylprolyl isomerase [Bacteroidota bacterium]
MTRAGLVCAGGMLLLCAACGREEEGVLARAGDVIVRVDEFRERYAAYLAMGSVRDNIAARRDVLNNMLNEGLIHADMRRQGLDRDAEARDRIDAIRAQALLDGYARRISTDTLTVPEEELKEEFRRTNTRVRARYVYGPTREDALRLRRRLESGESFEALAREVFEDPGLASNGGSLGSFTAGEMEPALEEAAFALPPGALSGPVKLSMGFAIIRVDDRRQVPLASEYDYARKKEQLARTVVERKTLEYLGRELEGIRGRLAPRFRKETAAELLGSWNALFPEEGAAVEQSGSAASPDFRARELVRWQEGAWSVEEFIRRARASTDRQRRRVKTEADLEEFVTGLAAREVLAVRARASSLEEDPAVRAQVEKHTGIYMLKRWRSRVEEAAVRGGWPEDSLRDEFRRNGSRYMVPPEVNVAEILVRTRKEAEDLARRVRRGEDFGALARRYSIRPSSARASGELGFGTRTTFGILGDRFFSARRGAIIGPEFVDPYYGVFTILERREGRPMTFEEARGALLRDRTASARSVAFRAAVDGLRSRAEVVMDMDMLANLVVE